jgi:sugar lactone lactonase YvrE
VESTTKKQHEMERRCGRPLGLRFHGETGELYVADAYYGLMSVGPNGGVATSLAREVGGSPVNFANDLDIHRNGSVFFTDTSTRYNRKCAAAVSLSSVVSILYFLLSFKIF